MVEMRWRRPTREEFAAGKPLQVNTQGMLLEYRHRQYSAALPANIDHSWSEWTVVPVVTA